MKVYATYLPGFHNDPYNNIWWGENFTEWNNVISCKPLYPGHRQPSIPLNGAYNLGDPTIIEEQFSIAERYGIDAFFIYGYWSMGKQPLSKPLNVILNNVNLKVKFSYFWGNHSWTRSWTNRSGATDVLLSQEYGIGNDLNNFCKYLHTLFMDSRYEKIDNRPIFTIYRPNDIPDLENYLDKFRNYFNNNFGYSPYIIGTVTTWQSSYGWANLFDNILLFQPSSALFGANNLGKLSTIGAKDKVELHLRSLPDAHKKILYYILDRLPAKHKKWDYSQILQKAVEQTNAFKAEYPNVIPMVCAGFDNTPRYNKRAKILENFNLEAFGNAIRNSILEIQNQKYPILMINAWNEWGEGMFLEPDKDMGYAKLEELKKSLNILNIK